MEQEKTKPTHGFWESLTCIIKLLGEKDKGTVYRIILLIPIGVLVPAIGVYLPKLVLSELETGQTPRHLLMAIGLLSIIIIIVTYIQNYMKGSLENKAEAFRVSLLPIFANKLMDTDYENLENPDFNKLRVKTLRLLFEGGEQDFNKIPIIFYETFSNMLGLVLYSIVISTLTPWILLLVIVTTLGNYFCTKAERTFEETKRPARSIIFHKLHYVVHKTCDFPLGKDIRLYRMEHWIRDVYTMLIEKKLLITKSVEKNQLGYAIINHCLLLIRDGLAYGYLIYCVLYGDMLVSDFTLYLGIIAGLSSWFKELLKSFDKLSRLTLGFSDIIEFQNYRDIRNTEEGVSLPTESELPCTLEFDNISYRYPNSEKDTITHFNLTIKAGEKLAIVGVNGAGKTTLIKLLCGFYTPTAGRILMNGKDMLDYNREDYLRLVSGVFQDIHFLPITLGENIAQCPEKEIDKEKVWKCLELADIAGKIRSLPEGLNSLLVKSIHDNAVDFSGGENQKLVLARSLYKNAPILILDEPTAALDPIAENEMYLKYAELSKNKTSLYISHRLSSTRFCDRIIYIEHGTIVESGTHDELINLGGRYAHMFEVQSHYYNEQQEEEVYE